MDDIKKSVEDLKSAFAGESQANRKYLAFAKKADEEGLPSVARLFRAAAAAETVHALSHLRAMDAVGSTKDNLKAAIDGETFEFEKMYPEMIADAKKEGATAALRSFHLANEVEKIHANLYKKALDNPVAEVSAYYVCLICGNTTENTAPDKCPICGAAKEQFEKII